MSYLHCLFFDQTILITEAKLQMKAEVNFANEYKVVSSLNKEFYFCTADIKKMPQGHIIEMHGQLYNVIMINAINYLA